MKLQTNRATFSAMLVSTACIAALGACATPESQTGVETVAPATSTTAPQGPAIAVSVAASETALSSAGMEAAALVLDTDTLTAPQIIAATGMGGLEISPLKGDRLARISAGEAIGVDVAYNFFLSGTNQTLIGAIDQVSDSLRFFTLGNGSLQEVGAGREGINFAAENVCMYQHPLDGLLYAFIVGDGGQVSQNLVYETDSNQVSMRPVREIRVPSTIKQCAADSSSGKIFISEETVGIWQFNADPESETGAVMIDRVDRGHITEEVGGIAVYDAGDEAKWLLASNLGERTINVYDLNADGAFAGSVLVSGKDGHPMDEPGQLHADGVPLGLTDSAGNLLVADEENSSVQMVSIADIGAALGLSTEAGTDPRAPQSPKTLPVRPTVESDPVANYGDAADDPVIWANPGDPSASRVIATDKQEGLYVYDMNGKTVQFLADGKMNNVDLRGGFSLGGQDVTLVTASDRTHGTIAIYAIDAATGLLRDVANGPQPTGLSDPYGLCMSKDPASGRTYVYINGDETRKRQWELTDAGNGKVNSNLVRDLTFDSQTEGCVSDDATGTLYVGEEDVGIWKLETDPATGDTKALMDTVEDNPYLVDDVEGMSIYHLKDGGGYLVVSSQGDDTYALFDLETDAYVGSVAIVANADAGIDGASETDGLDVSSANLGPGFEQGALIVQDGRNVMPSENQNYKYVPWSSISEALDLSSN